MSGTPPDSVPSSPGCLLLVVILQVSVSLSRPQRDAAVSPDQVSPLLFFLTVPVLFSKAPPFPHSTQNGSSLRAGQSCSVPATEYVLNKYLSVKCTEAGLENRAGTVPSGRHSVTENRLGPFPSTPPTLLRARWCHSEQSGDCLLM